MLTHVIWDLGETLVTPPNGGQDLQPLDLCMEIALRSGVVETLETIRQSGCVQAVLSNTATSDSDAARRLLERLGIASYFTFIYATQSELDDNKPEKPDPVVFELVLNALGIQAHQAVMVGNSWDNDILGANRSGLHAIWLKNPAVAARRDETTPVQSPPWIVPVWDVADVPQALGVLQASTGSEHNLMGLSQD
ncbi:HAD family hydrolase [Alicyclobacillus fodiniaquatilis]|uniref:HAD family hydrolase n=1 Tax=Alicyclobacillus fodiniaquatilis TaxID=1661150 RepID=A0ABW4JCJ6_9BACL